MIFIMFQKLAHFFILTNIIIKSIKMLLTIYNGQYY
jgi:hypothetical protein